MIITCPDCSAKYKVRDELIPDQGKKVRCKKCSAVFRAYLDGRMDVEQDAPKPASQPAPPAATGQPAATVMIDADHIKKMVNQQRAASPAQTQPMPVVSDQTKAAQTTPQPSQPAASPPKPAPTPAELDASGSADRFGTLQMRVPDEFAPPQKDPSPLASDFDRLSFDSQNNDYKAELNDFNFEATSEPDMGFGDELDQEPAAFATQAMPAAAYDEPAGFADIGDTSDPFSGDIPVPEQKPSRPGHVSYQALIEGTPYPNLTLDVLDRWIKEGRLLEGDQLTRMGEDDYQRADSFPPVKSIFAKYFGDQSGRGGPKKKGFFARLFGK